MSLRYFVILLFSILFPAGITANQPYMLWIEFSDKDNSPYSLTRPHEFLTPRAIERRQRQRIPLDHLDLPVSYVYVKQLSELAGVSVYFTSRWFNGALVATESVQTKADIKQLEFVVNAEIVKPGTIAEMKNKENNGGSQRAIHSFQGSEKINPNETKRLVTSISTAFLNFYPEYGLARNQIELVNGQYLHKQGFWGHGKVIAVFDSGFSNVDTLEAFSHLWFDGKILGSRDFVVPGGNVFRNHFHGTHVLSVMGALVEETYAGVALGASYWLLRTEDGATEFRIEEYNWLAGAEFADSVGADIINSSLGYTQFDDESQNYTYHDLDGRTTVVARAANKAFNKGMLVVTSAGNYGNQTWRYIGSPADALGALSVGGTDYTGARVSFSSVGPTADGRIKPEVMAQGHAVATISHEGGNRNANGTSFASPMVAGLAACLWQAFPNITNKQIKNAIIQSGDRFLSPDTLYGKGVPDFEKAFEIILNQQPGEPYVSLALNPLMFDSALIFYSEISQNITIELINISGQRILFINDLLVAEGYNEIKPFVKIDNLTAGVYFIRMNFKDRTELIKAVKL